MARATVLPFLVKRNFFLVVEDVGASPAASRATGLYLAALDGTRKRFPPIRATIPGARATTQIEGLQLARSLR